MSLRLAAVLAPLAVATSCGLGHPSGRPAVNALAGTAHEGEALYRRYCSTCHGEDGLANPGTKAVNLNNQGLLTIVDDEYLYRNIALGRPGENGRGRPGTKMPVFSSQLGGPLQDREIRLIVEYVRGWQTEPAVQLDPFEASGDIRRGSNLYARACAECHGVDGWSDRAPSLAGRTFQDTASDAMIRYVVSNGLEGATMPAARLDDADMASLITYLRQLD